MSPTLTTLTSTLIHFTCLAVAVPAVVGCDAEAPASMSDANRADRDVEALGAAPDAALETRAELEDLIHRYVQAVRDGDLDALQDSLSGEMLERLDIDGDGSASVAELDRFATSESRKIELSLGDDVASEPFVVERVVLLDAGASAELWVSHAGVELPKPHYASLEGGSWRYGSVALRQTRSTHSYKVRNSSGAGRTVSCSGGVSKSIGNGATGYLSCTDVCGVFAGTSFKYAGYNWACDYNTWGVDFTLTGSSSAKCMGNC